MSIMCFAQNTRSPISSVVPPFFEIWVQRKREGFIFWPFVSSLAHRGHILMYKIHQKVHFAR